MWQCMVAIIIIVIIREMCVGLHRKGTNARGCMCRWGSTDTHRLSKIVVFEIVLEEFVKTWGS